MDPDYVESVWWSLKQIFDKGLLVQDHRVAPYCPRCGTGLSDHELAQGYETVVDPSVYVRFPVTSGPLPCPARRCWSGRRRRGRWSPTPPSPSTRTSPMSYARRPTAGPRRRRTACWRVLGDDVEVLVLPGRDLELTPYTRPFDLVDIPDAHFVVLADYVTTEDGTGLVHQAPAFGADDLLVARQYGLPVVNPVRPDGHLRGRRAAGRRGVLQEGRQRARRRPGASAGCCSGTQPYEHSYPHCWRCHTPLIYYAQPSWYIRTTADQGRAARARTPRPTGTRRRSSTAATATGSTNNIDWALSRNRYWGTPLPIWRCAEGHLTVRRLAGRARELAGQDLSALDPHRPYVDDVTFACPTAASRPPGSPRSSTPGTTRARCRSPSGATRTRARREFEAAYPAQFICEAIDQTRGWFYTLMAVGTLVFDRSSYENVLCLGHILDEDGRKMSKHLGNILEPIPLMDGTAPTRCAGSWPRPARRGSPAGSGTPRSRRSSARPC